MCEATESIATQRYMIFLDKFGAEESVQMRVLVILLRGAGRENPAQIDEISGGN